MITFKTIKKVARWLLIPLLFQAFVVSGSFAAVDAALSKDPSFKIPVCFISGLKWVEVKTDHSGQKTIVLDKTNVHQESSPKDHNPADHGKHCSMCSALSAVPVIAAVHKSDWIKFQSFHTDFEEHAQHLVEACLPPPSQAPPQPA